MKWFRHYVGMTRDDKLMAVAAKTRQPLDRVMFVWIAILESASECEDGGRYDVDAEMVAYTIRCEPGDVKAIMLGLEVAERVSDGVVSRWKQRQFESDTSRDRMRRHRNKQNGGGNSGKPHGDGTRNSRDGSVTSQNRTVTTPEAETDPDVPSPSGDGRPAADEREPEFVFTGDGEPSRPKLVAVNGEVVEPEPRDPEKLLFEMGKEVLLRGPNPVKKGGSLIASLLRSLNNDVAKAQECVDLAWGKHDPAEYLGACLKKAKTHPPARAAPVNPRLAASRLLGDHLNAQSH